MTTHFITAEVDCQESPARIHQAIEAELRKYGEPLRWAITHVDTRIHVEAVVTTGSKPVVSA